MLPAPRALHQFFRPLSQELLSRDSSCCARPWLLAPGRDIRAFREAKQFRAPICCPKYMLRVPCLRLPQLSHDKSVGHGLFRAVCTVRLPWARSTHITPAQARQTGLCCSSCPTVIPESPIEPATSAELAAPKNTVAIVPHLFPRPSTSSSRLTANTGPGLRWNLLRKQQQGRSNTTTAES